jgi:hypothetical protein
MKTRLTFLADHDSRLIYLNGKPEDIKLDHLLLFNHGATDEELEWIFENRAAFYTSETKLRRGLESIFYHRILNDDEMESVVPYDELSEETAEALAIPLAQEVIDGMEKESKQPIYVAINRPYKDAHEFALGTIQTAGESAFRRGE